MTLPAGTLLGNYELLGPLGAGGMGEVYRALDRKLGREVAIKVLPPAFAEDPGRIARFEREARLLASVNHPAIAAIYGAEESGAVRYLVLELVPGETLAERLTTGPLPIRETLEIGRQVADGLEAAHERGIVHRDLKPANVKVTPEGKVKILDLGLAKALDFKAEEENISLSPTAGLDQTRPGMILGTAEFMSPEQARGKALDKRTDIWSFGCILFEMLSGRRAFTGETLPDVLTAILSSEPDWAALPHPTPLRVRELLGRCLQKDPNKRLRDVGDARYALDDALAESEGRSAASLPPAALPRARRRALQFLVAGGVVALAVAAILVFRTRDAPIPTEKYLAVLPFKDLGGAPAGQLLGDGLVETVSTRLANLAGVQVVTPTAAVAAADSRSDVRLIARDLGANLILRGAIHREGGRVRITYTIFTLAEGKAVSMAAGSVEGLASEVFALQDRLSDSVAQALKLPLSAPGPSAPTGLETADQQERYLRALGYLQRYDQSSSVDAAIGLLEALAREPPDSPVVQAALARAFLHRYTLTQESVWAAKAVEACDRAVRLGSSLPDVYVTRGQVLTRTGHPVEAIVDFESALARVPNSLDALMGLADAYQEAGRSSDAETTYRKAIGLQPNYWAVYNRLGVFYFRTGKYQKAVEMFQRVVALTPDNVRGYNNLGAAYQKDDDFERARSAYATSARLQPNGGAFANQGTLEFFLGRYAEATRAFERAVELVPTNALYWSNLGDAYRWTPGLRSRATAAYERAQKIAREQLRTNPRDASALDTLGISLAKTGKPAEGLRQIEAALAIEPGNPDLFYDAAVVTNLLGRTENAIDWLRRAVDAGLSRKQLEREPEFQNLRGQPAYREVLSPKKASN
jgi:serine/threonine-protein kinase